MLLSPLPKWDEPLIKNTACIGRASLNAIENVLVLKPHEIMLDGSQGVRKLKPGEIYPVGGLLKAKVLLDGFATLDLNSKQVK